MKGYTHHLDRRRGHSLLTGKEAATMPGVYSTDGDGDPLDRPVGVKLFCPYSGSLTFYGVEYDGEGGLWGYFVSASGAWSDNEWGYLYLDHAAGETLAGGLPLWERDRASGAGRYTVRESLRMDGVEVPERVTA